ncbi:MAG: NAD(P)H-dependent oxidoreductase [Clostridia bacterium]|nr:NAD(P)H-dependent oxidoreductase [Clostridia bacterium]
MVLLINACARAESRTFALARTAAKLLSDTYTELDLYKEDIRPVDGDTLTKRDLFISRRDYTDSMFRYAKQFRDAEGIIVAAPYWDMSFPAVLKCYVEAICVNGLTFRYTEKGVPEGLCKAKRLVYVTTAGGYIGEYNYGYDYIRQLSVGLFGIRETVCIKAEGLDIEGADTGCILEAAKAQTETILKS